VFCLFFGSVLFVFGVTFIKKMTAIKHFSVFNGAYYLARFADQGLSNALGLATLRHGTNPYSWVSIHIMGADPSYGGAAIGGDFGMGFDHQNRNNFFVAHRYTGRVISRGYAMMSTANLINKIIPYIGYVFGIYIGLILPNIKFRFSDKEIQGSFRVDPTMRNDAIYTGNRICPWRIGVIGTIFAVFSTDTFENMCSDPLRVITGIAQLALVGFVAFYVCPYMKSFKVAAVAGVILAII
jgi:hypothetical protein